VREIRRNEQHDSFINAVTHELKTPIASIRLYLETLQSREVSEAQRREFYRVMLSDTDRLQQTVEQVLKAGIAGQRGGVLHRAPVDITALAADTADLARVRHHLAPDAVSVSVATPAPSGLLVDGDADELRTALSNLIDNAVKYSRDHIQVSIEVAAPSPDTVWLRVRDRGVGIPRAQLKRIFNRFYRFQTRGFKVKGTGLGLFIVRSIVKQHGGRVFAESEGEGKGSTFTMELPRLVKT
jgi:two-component system sensor histidine kinase SenX3